MFAKLLTGLAAVSAVSGLGIPLKRGGAEEDYVCKPDMKLNLYWGQKTDSQGLAYYCETYKPDYITLSFMNTSPENGGETGYPGTNFAGHCGGDVYTKDGKKSLLLDCPTVAADAQKCQAYGVKVLLSIGGGVGEYGISTEQAGEEWAKFLYTAYGPYSPEVEGYPRPLDTEDGYFSIDGFDMDIEKHMDNKPWIAMINKLRYLWGDKHLIITGAPQCPLNPEFAYMTEMIEAVAFDALFIQFYNNPGCDAVEGNAEGESFNYGEWEKLVSLPGSVQAGTKLYFGVQAIKGTSGYVEPAALSEVVCGLISGPANKHFGGVSVWDAVFAEQLVGEDGHSYLESVQQALRCGCDDTTDPTDPTDPADPTDPYPDPEPTEPYPDPKPTDSYPSADPTYDHTDYPTEYPTYPTGYPTGDHEDPYPSSDPYPGDDEDDEYPGHGGHGGHHGGHNGHEDPYPTSSKTKTKDAPYPPHYTHKPSHTYTSTITYTNTYTVTSCPPEKGGCYKGAMTTEIVYHTTTYCEEADAEPTKDADYYPTTYKAAPQPTYKAPAHSYKAPEQPYKAPEQSYKAPVPAAPYSSMAPEYPTTYEDEKNDAVEKPYVSSAYPTMETSYYPTADATYDSDAVPAETKAPYVVTAGAGSAALSVAAVFVAAVLAL